jgi:hypothetical protein
MDHSPFGKLPAELRNRVYEYLLAGGDHAFFCITTRYNDQGVAVTKATVQGNPSALAKTCRTTRDEYAPLFYSNNEFMIRGRSGEEVLKSFNNFASTIGKRNACALRRVIFRVLEQRMDSFETVCSTHRDVESILERTVLAKRGEQYRQCHFQVQIDLVHCSRAPANATFLLNLDFDKLESSWDENMETLQRKRKRFNLNGDFRPIIFMLEENREHLRDILNNVDMRDRG